MADTFVGRFLVPGARYAVQCTSCNFRAASAAATEDAAKAEITPRHPHGTFTVTAIDYQLRRDYVAE